MEDGRMSWSKELRGEVKREEIEANKVGGSHASSARVKLDKLDIA